MSEPFEDPPRWREHTDQANLAERAFGRALRALKTPAPLSGARLARLAANLPPRPARHSRARIAVAASFVLGLGTAAAAARLDFMPRWVKRDVKLQPAAVAPASTARDRGRGSPSSRMPATAAAPIAEPAAPEPTPAALVTEPAVPEPTPAARALAPALIPVPSPLGEPPAGRSGRPHARPDPSVASGRPTGTTDPETPADGQARSSAPAAGALGSPHSGSLTPPATSSKLLVAPRPEKAEVQPPAEAEVQPAARRVAMLEPSRPAAPARGRVVVEPASLGETVAARIIADAIRLLRVNGSPQSALALLDRHTAILGTSRYSREVLLVRVDALVALKRDGELLRLLDGAGLTDGAASRTLLLTRGRLRAMADRCREALADFDRVLAESGRADGQALLGRAACRERLGDSAGARADRERYRQLTGAR